MTSRVIHLRMKDRILVGCLDYIEDKTSVADSVKRTLDAFITAMQESGKLPKRTPREIQDILMKNKILPLPEVEIDLESVKGFVDEDVNIDAITAIAREVEEAIQSSSTPEVRTSVNITERPADEQSPKRITLNLFAQPRTPIAELRQRAPKDRFIEQSRIPTEGLDDTERHKREVFIAAVEVAYTGISQDLWGTTGAENHIKGLIAMHREDI